MREITARKSPRLPLRPELPNGRLAVAVALEPMVNVVAVPITAPVELKNEIVPVHDAAVPLAEAAAKLTTVMRAVSVEPSPNGASECVSVLVVVVVV